MTRFQVNRIMECLSKGCVTHLSINEKIATIIECDQIYIRFMESRLKIQEEEVEFLHRLQGFHNQFSMNRSLYNQFRLFREEYQEISDRVFGVQKKLEVYQKKFQESFEHMIKSSNDRSVVLRKLKRMVSSNSCHLELSHVEMESTNISTKEELLLEKINLEEAWLAFREYANEEIMACHYQFHILCKEFSV